MNGSMVDKLKSGKIDERILWNYWIYLEWRKSAFLSIHHNISKSCYFWNNFQQWNTENDKFVSRLGLTWLIMVQTHIDKNPSWSHLIKDPKQITLIDGAKTVNYSSHVHLKRSCLPACPLVCYRSAMYKYKPNKIDQANNKSGAITSPNT